MIKITDKTKCCGCTACYNVCPVKAITMKPDEEGFLYPIVAMDKCIQCNRCENVCPVLNKKHHDEVTEGYIVRYKDAKIVEESTSGGAFTAFASYLMNNGYVVYGAGYDNSMQVVCKMASKSEELKEMRGSKFVQSYLGTTFQIIKNQLKQGQKVLFTGTPCQVSGLISYLGDKPENLFCIDFVCRGVASPALWENYVTMMEQKYGAKMVNARFKNKTYGYHTATMKLDFANGKKWYGSGRVDPMMKAFVTELASRPSCHACAFKGVERISDVTMFDCYEFSSITKLKDDNRGYTSLFIHTEKGKKIFSQIETALTIYSVDIDKLVTKNGIMVNWSSKPNPKRNEFYRYAGILPIGEAIDKTIPITRKDHLIEKTKKILYMTGLIKVARKFKKNTVEVND